MRSLRLRSVELGFWVDVNVVVHSDRWVAVAWIGGDPEIGVGDSKLKAVMHALRSLGPDAEQILVEQARLTETI